MATQIQYRRGTAAQNNTFTGAAGEVTVDTTNASLRVHDGATAGGSGTVVSIIASTGGSNITGNLLPSANLVYNLGSPTLRWKTGYFSANTVDIGGGQISLDPINGFSFTISGVTSSMAANGAITSNTLTAPTVSITSTTASTSTTTGALVVAGGAGIGGNVFFGNAITVNSLNLPTAINNGGTNAVGNIGATGKSFNTVFALATSAQYADLAEFYIGDSNYEIGTVMIIGGSKEVTQSTTSHDPAIAGVISEKPAFKMNDSMPFNPKNNEYQSLIALQGRVPVKVLGPVSKGDRVVSSHIAGVAQRLNTQLYQPGCIIGKALQAIDSTDILVIEVVVGRL